MESIYQTRSLKYLEYMRKELSICIQYKMLKQEFGSHDMVEQAYTAIMNEIDRRQKEGIVNPEGFCDSVDNDNIYWECECDTCVRQLEEFNAAADEWEDQNGEEYDIGKCGSPCDGHCEVCNPGLMERALYGTYDVLGEI